MKPVIVQGREGIITQAVTDITNGTTIIVHDGHATTMFPKGADSVVGTAPSSLSPTRTVISESTQQTVLPSTSPAISITKSPSSPTLGIISETLGQTGLPPSPNRPVPEDGGPDVAGHIAQTTPPATVATASKTAPPVTASKTAKTPPTTMNNPTPQSHVSTSSSPTVPIGVLIGVVLAVVLMGATLFVCYFRVVKRRQVVRLAHMTTSTENGVPSPLLRLLFPQAVPEPRTSPSPSTVQENIASDKFIPAMQQYSSVMKGGQINPATAPSSFLQPDMDLVSTHRENERRRAVDAGPVADNVEDEDDRESTLPPEYRDVFDISRSPTASR